MKPLQWVYMDYRIDSPEVKRLASEAGVSRLVAVVAANRGIFDGQELKRFINNDHTLLHSPFLFEEMGNAVSRIEYAISNGEKICVYGDYDVDGITSTALLVSYLRRRGADCSYYIPERADEGYGINTGAVKQLKEGGVSLIISVDTGITAVEEAQYARSIGVDLIVTDHHRCKEQLPQCVALINPQLPGCAYPFKNLAGVGVVFKLICALEGCDNATALEKYSELAALGTIADVVSLTGENRAIVTAGLKKISSTNSPGIKALLRVAGMEDRPVTVGGVGFSLAPRINAAGRVGSPECAVRLLLSNDEDEAAELARKLDIENRNRQQTETGILEQVLDIMDKNPDFLNKKVIVLGGEGWHHGVIGIVASRVADRYCRPCILISCENGIGKGSGRSVKGFNLFEALSSCSQLLNKFGGHELAAGLSLDSDKIEELDRSLNSFADANMDPDCLKPALNIDCELSADYVNIEEIKSLAVLEPYGIGNPQPVFAFKGLKICNIRLFGEGRHLRLDVLWNGRKLEMVGFNMSAAADEFTAGDIVDAAGCLMVNKWNGQSKPQILLKDLVLKSQIAQCCPVPGRSDFAALYSLIRQSNGRLSAPLELLCRRLKYSANITFSPQKLLNCLDVLSELKLATYTLSDGRADIYLLSTGGKKVNLESSKRLQTIRRELAQNKSCLG